MFVFWLTAGLGAALAAMTVMAFSARRATAQPEDAQRIAAARQFDELDALRDRGLLDEDSWRTARAEAGRRLLAESAPETLVSGPVAKHRTWVLAAVLACAALTAGVYAISGSPGMADQPYAARVETWAGSLDDLDAPRLAAVAERVARERPEDPEAWVFAGRARFEAGDPLGSATAFRRALQRNPDRPEVWAWLGEALTRAQDGVVGTDAEAAFRQAVQRDPQQGAARYYLGRAALERGDVDGARDHWGVLLAVLPAEDPRAVELRRLLDAAAAP